MTTPVPAARAARIWETEVETPKTEAAQANMKTLTAQTTRMVAEAPTMEAMQAAAQTPAVQIVAAQVKIPAA